MPPLTVKVASCPRGMSVLEPDICACWLFVRSVGSQVAACSSASVKVGCSLKLMIVRKSLMFGSSSKR